MTGEDQAKQTSTPMTDAHLAHLNLPDGRKVGIPDETVELLKWLERKLAIAELIAELKGRGTLANNLCPDHRDKQVGKPCLACRIETLERLSEAKASQHASMKELLGLMAYKSGRWTVDNFRFEARRALELLSSGQDSAAVTIPADEYEALRQLQFYARAPGQEHMVAYFLLEIDEIGRRKVGADAATEAKP